MTGYIRLYKDVTLTRQKPDAEHMDCRILNVTQQLFVNTGYHNASVHDVQLSASARLFFYFKLLELGVLLSLRLVIPTSTGSK